jgi:hypothetical protein
MAEKGNQAPIAPSSGADFLEQIEEVQVKMHNRVAATKPLDKFLSLVGVKDSSSNDYERLKSRQDDDENTVGVIQIYIVTRPRLFGLRMGIRIEDDEHLLGVDGSVEYRWQHDIEYPRGPLEEFLAVEAVPRLSISVWTVMAEIGRGVGADIPSASTALTDGVIAAVRHQLDAHPGSEKTW